LTSYFTDLADPRFATSSAFGHNRYATNTSTSFTRVQPFPVFAHNGEINTISRLREEARALGLPLSRDGSDSQDVDAAIRALVIRHGLTAVESIELLFPPIVNEMKRMTAELQDAYVQGRAAIGPLAQGPAGILVRVGDTCVFGVDALGLRPLWHVETEDEHVFASERGFVPLERYVSDPVPLAPGERVALRRDRGWRLLDQGAVRERFRTAREPRGPPPRDGGGGDESRDRPRARDRAFLHACSARPAARAAGTRLAAVDRARDATAPWWPPCLDRSAERRLPRPRASKGHMADRRRDRSVHNGCENPAGLPGGR